MKKIVSILLFLAAVTTVGCSSESTAKVTETVPPESESVKETEAIDYSKLSLLERLQIDREAVPDGLPETSYGGYQFRVMLGTGVPEEISSESETGDVLNDAFFKRKIAVEERFDVKLTTIQLNYPDFASYLTALTGIMMAGDDVYDLMTLWNTMTKPLTIGGYFLDLSEISTIDFSKPWFYQDAIAQLSYKNHIYCSVDAVKNIYPYLSCVLFDKTLARNYNLDDLYEVVRSGKWTLDYLESITKDVTADLNGDGSIKWKTDQMAVTIPSASFSCNTLPSFGIYMLTKDENDVPYLTADVAFERYNDFYTKMRAFIVSDPGITKTDDWSFAPFEEGRSVFAVATLNETEKLRDSNVEYGILPVFKFDENQKDYCSSFLPDPTVIPGTCSNPERSGVIMSALAAYGYKYVAPVYFGTVLKSKYANDADSIEMLDIIANNVTSDGLVMFLDAIYFFHDFAGISTKKEFASYYETKSAGLRKGLEEACAALDLIVDQ